jgi:ribonuclease E
MKRMLINATQAEERRLAIVDGQNSSTMKSKSKARTAQGNIYKAVVTRVEPSLEACFVDYGEDRHGFLPFKEISKSYFAQGVPVSQARISDASRKARNCWSRSRRKSAATRARPLPPSCRWPAAMWC